MKKKINVIGSGFSSLSVACHLAKSGFEVKIFEKNDSPGGRARQLKEDGFTFDMGPTWYWMPDVFERFFNSFGKSVEEYYKLIRLDPGYMVYFSREDKYTIPASLTDLYSLFDSLEKGSSKKLEAFLNEAEYNYNLAIKDLVYRPGNSPLELVTKETLLKLNLFLKSISQQIKGHLKHPYLVQMLEFPVLFLGAKPENTPAFYNFMNYADLKLGTWYPEGGMFEVVKSMVELAKELGVEFLYNSNVEEIVVENNLAKGIVVNGKLHEADITVSGADYHHTEKLLPPKFRGYSEKYWNNRTLAPSALLFYLGIDTKVKNVEHHTLFFDADFKKHAVDIYDDPKWPEDPLFYASFPSKTDKLAAPEGKENAIILIPVAPGIEDNENLREKYYDLVMDRLENLVGQEIKKYISYKKSYSINDFIGDYNSFKGNAYGLANTLMQTAFLRPKIKSKKVPNLYFTGQLTVPGPGVPPSLISGEIVAKEIERKLI
ncbi:phytoene desaturase family protein [Flexithrix dorotheae]|uniref:phytoene desaturase family protein n=1 Tax=Flexithrix dorotheae TaxID=70993 RepID=UPI00037AAF7C|nr:phytoene desaturase family protein [Flexithrix dorotheae]